MDSDTQAGGVEPSTDPPDTSPPLYKFGSSDERVRSLVHSVGLIVAAFVVGFALALIGLRALVQLGYVQNVENIPPGAQALAAALQFVGFLAVGLWYLRWRGREADLFRVAVPSLRDVGWAVLGLVGLFVLLNVVSVLIGLFGIESAENAAVVSGREQPTLFLYLIGVTLLFTAPAEELLFRGLIQGLFRSAYGLLPGIVITAVLFGVVHFVALAGGGSPVPYIAVAAALGVVLGGIYEKTENLAVPILVHGAYNAILFYAAYLAATGQIEMPT
jgi:membrane protease YdiL (CAAX protease family)